jgi:hypothetical protein
MFFHGTIKGQIIATHEPKGTTPDDWAEYVVLNAPSEYEAATLLRDWLGQLTRWHMTQLMAQLMGGIGDD